MCRFLNLLTFLIALWAVFCYQAADATTIQTVPVGNAGNAGDFQGADGTFGRVNDSYRIGKFEVTNAQYTDFLNEKATGPADDPLGLWTSEMGDIAQMGGIARSGPSGSFTYLPLAARGDRPVNFVSWYDAIRFANWLHNGQGNGDTETGTYTLLGGTPTPSNGNSITRNPGAIWFLPSEDEWYKAAYHKNDGVTGNYWDFPTGSDTPPTGEAPPGGANSANFAIGTVTDVGAYTLSDSPYGTFDQGGNVAEWNESLITSTARGLRGGSWISAFSDLAASTRGSGSPTSGSERNRNGFRVATIIPEPSSLTLAGLGLVGVFAFGWRRRRCS